MARVPVIRLGTTLLASIQDDLRDRDALDLLQDVGLAIEKDDTRGVILDLSVVQTVDSFLGRLFGDLATGSRLMGVQTVIVGMQPSVAITLVELGLELDEVATALNLEKGIALLARLIAKEDRGGRQPEA